MSAHDRRRRGIDDRGRIWSVEETLRVLRQNYTNAVRAGEHVRRLRAWTALSVFVERRNERVRSIHKDQDETSHP